jgi:putative toxin-antitoxin system antitoxin component (TIGR02293 family)
MNSAALKVLGFRNIKEGKISSTFIIDLIDKGFTKRNYVNLKDALGFTNTRMANILSVSTKTIESYKVSDHLPDTASERLFKLAEIAALGSQVFDKDHDLFNDWLNKPLRPLNGKKPIDMMTNIYGLDMVKNLLGRIEYSVYS